MIKKVPVISQFFVRPRLASGILAGCLIGALMPAAWDLPTQVLAGWDGGLIFYLTSMVLAMNSARPEDICETADQQEEGRLAVLLYMTVAVAASIVAIFMELAMAKDETGMREVLRISLAGATVLLSWAFMHTMFAIHYAHEYYSARGGREKGLLFPGHNRPGYWDFVHFSFIIGVASQTADIQITAPGVRHISTVHSILAFFFNTILLALLINIGSSLLG